MKREIKDQDEGGQICILKDNEEWIRERPKRDLQEISTFALRHNLRGHRFFKHGEVTHDHTSSLSIDGFGCATAAFLYDLF
jgi:hypothetical protein